MAAHEQPLLSVVIVSYNTVQLLHDCLASLHAAGGSMLLEIVVVDNASTDSSVELIRTTFPDVRVLVNQENVGFGVANNQGVAAAKGRYAMLLNSDTVMWPGTIERLVTYLEHTAEVGMVAPRLLNADGSDQRSAFRFPTPLVLLLEQLSLAPVLPMTDYRERAQQAHTPFAVDWVLGACMLARRDLLAALGLFDPRFFMYAEDIDLCYRLQSAGHAIHLVPAAVVTHFGGMSARQQPLRMALQSTASMYLFYRKHYNRPALLLAVLIFRGAAVARWLRDAARWAGLALPGTQPARRRMLIENLRLWMHVLRLRPPRLPGTNIPSNKRVESRGSSMAHHA